MRWNDQTGFSLIEVMLAVLILGMSLTVFFSTSGEGIRVVSRARGYQMGRELLDWMELQEPLDLEDVEEGVEQGILSHPEAGSFSWEREILLAGPEEDRLFLVVTRVASSEDTDVKESREMFLYVPVARRRGWVKEPWDG